MRKIYLLALISICSMNIWAQQVISKSSVNRYSHILQGLKNGKPVLSGSSFVIHYQKQYYVVSAYHVFTGKNPLTNQPVMPLPDQISIYFYNTVRKNLYEYRFDLYKNGRPLYYSTNGKFDVAILPITLNDSILRYANAIEANNIDTSAEVSPGKELLIVGFPKDCKYVNGWEPTIFTSLSVLPPKAPGISGPVIYPLVYFDKDTHEGSSGCPVFIMRKEQKSLKVLAVNSLSPTVEIGSNIKGGAVYLFYVIQIIGHNKKHP